MSRPHVRTIGTLLLLIIRISSSSVSRRLGNDEYFLFFKPLNTSVENFSTRSPTPVTTPIPNRKPVSSANTTVKNQNVYWEELGFLQDVIERNLSNHFISSSFDLNVEHPLVYGNFDEFPEVNTEDVTPWLLAYSRARRNSSIVNETDTNATRNFNGGLNKSHENIKEEITILLYPLTPKDNSTSGVTAKNTLEPTGYIVSRKNEDLSFNSHSWHVNDRTRSRPALTSSSVVPSSRRRYPRYQQQHQYLPYQEQSSRWPGLSLSQDPNYHPISDAQSNTISDIRTQNSLFPLFQSRGQSSVEHQNSVRQYLWSLYDAKNEENRPNSPDSPNLQISSHLQNSRYSPRIQHITLLTPSPPHVEAYGHQTRSNSSLRQYLWSLYDAQNEENRPSSPVSPNLQNSHSPRIQHITLLTPSPPHVEAHGHQTRSNSSQQGVDSLSEETLSFQENYPGNSRQTEYNRSRARSENHHNLPNEIGRIFEVTTESLGEVDDSRSHLQHLGADHAEEDQEADENASSTMSDSTNLRVGKSLNIFSRYGFLTLSIKVRPPVGKDNYLFMENTAEVFQKTSYWSKRERRRHTGRFDDHFYIHFCENLNELLIAYFDHFTIEGVPKAHKAFTASLSVRDLAKQFGISSSFLRGRFSFVLVRLFRRKMRKTLQGPQTMQAALDVALRSIKIGSEESVHRFVDRFGTHVIREFEVGDMMYQTFVFGERVYKQLKNTFVTVGSESHLEQLQLYFSPRFATNVGSIQLASGNANLTTILQGWSVIPEQILYPTIFKVFDDPAVETELEQLDGEVVLSLKLDKITTRIPTSAATRWMSEVLDNSLALYYHNLDSTRDTS